MEMYFDMDLSLSISIHAPVKGATLRIAYPRLRRRHFNPRTREGCDA